MQNFHNNRHNSLSKSLNNLLESSRMIFTLVEIAQHRNYQLYLVGGFLRDILLGRSSKDVDFVTTEANELANSVAKQTGSKPVLIDRKFGTIRLIPSDPSTKEPFIVDLSPLRGPSIVDDLHQRDFTLNALALDITAWQAEREVNLLDPLEGIRDLNAGRLRACSHRSLPDDPLRILRAYRLVSTYALKLDTQTKESILKARHGVSKVAIERIRDELVLILAATNSFSVFKMLDDDGILTLLLPECEPLRSMEQNDFHHQGVWQHSLSALEALEFFLTNLEELLGSYAHEASAVLRQNLAGQRTRQIALKLGVLLHDIGKPSHRSVGKNGAIRFYGHEVTGGKLAASLCSRLCFSNKEIDFVSQLVRQHMRPIHLFNLTRTSKRALSRFFRLGPELFWPLLLLFASDYRATQGPDYLGGDLEPLQQKMHSWLDFYDSQLRPKETEPLLVSGHDIVNNLNLSPGPIVGKILNTLAELQWEGCISTRQQALDQAAELLKRWER
jgi:tRNA nucleotidyltransferase/poly(A) polymerase